MAEAFICDAVRTPIGRYGGALASVRADDLAAVPLAALMQRNPQVDWSKVDDLIFGCANQAGEDNRNVARMAVLLSGLPVTVPGTTYKANQLYALDEEEIDAYEIGVKTNWLDQRVTADATAFYYDYENLVVNVPTVLDPANPTVTSVLFRNAGAARIKGIELRADALPIPSLRVGGSLGFLAWAVMFFVHPRVGRLVDTDPALRPYLLAAAGLLPLAGWLAVAAAWGKAKA